MYNIQFRYELRPGTGTSLRVGRDFFFGRHGVSLAESPDVAAPEAPCHYHFRYFLESATHKKTIVPAVADGILDGRRTARWVDISARGPFRV